MGRARIISQLEPGRYQIELDHGTLQRDAMISEIETLLQGEALALQDADATIAGLQNQLDAKVALLNALIDEMNNPPAPEPDDGKEGEDGEEDDTEEVLDISERIGAAIIEVERARRTLSRAERQKANIVMKLASLRLQKSNLERVETNKTIEAWCTDGESDMTGEVGTAEVPGEPLMPILIKPGFDGGAAYDQARDGQMFERPLMNSAQAYLNAALLPGWQRWKPTYRFGAITAIDRDEGTCSIQLEPTRSSAQNLSINPSGMIHGVKAKYQDCDMDVFEEGDEVLIEMQSQSWTEPLVVGFKSDPRPCPLKFLFLVAGEPISQYSVDAGLIKPPKMINPSPANGVNIWPFFNHLAFFGQTLYSWYASSDHVFTIDGYVKQQLQTSGIPAVAATKNYVWSAHYMDKGSSGGPGASGDYGNMVFTQYDKAGDLVRQLVLPNTEKFYCIDVFAACGMNSEVVFAYPNANGGHRCDFIIGDDGSVIRRDFIDDYDVPYGGHGFGNQRLEIHEKQVRLYDGVSTDGAAIITSPDDIFGCAMQEDYIVISTETGKLICYDRNDLSELATYQIPQGRGGMVTVDAARMPVAS